LEQRRASADEWLALANQYDRIDALTNAANCRDRAAYAADVQSSRVAEMEMVQRV